MSRRSLAILSFTTFKRSTVRKAINATSPEGLSRCVTAMRISDTGFGQAPRYNRYTPQMLRMATVSMTRPIPSFGACANRW